MTNSPSVSLYNQNRFSDEDFVANFVARKKQTEALLNGLRNIAEGGPTEHQILIGARGMGKTSLLRRLAIGVMEDPILKSIFIPLRFREEQYNIISLDAFWRNCGEALAEWCEQHYNQELADRLDLAIESEEWRNDVKGRDGFLAACKEAGGRPILLLDNLDLILEGIDTDGRWSLRATLQRDNGPLVIGAATALLAEGADREKPFYEFFHPHILEPLSEQELLACLNALAKLRGAPGKPVKAILSKEPERIRTLYVLTGGNPRILGLVYGLLEQADSTEIFSDLEALLDQVTPFYKARIEEYQTPLQRAVIDGISLNWDPITSKSLGLKIGVETSTLSSQLNRLKKDGLIEEVKTSGTRVGYQLSERFLNIWYLMRHGTRKTKQRLRWFTVFLTKLFSAEELEKMALKAYNGNGKQQAGHYEAVKDAVQIRRKHEQTQETSEIDKQLSDIEKMSKSGRFEDQILAYSDFIEKYSTKTAMGIIVSVKKAMFQKARILRTLSRSEDAIDTYNQITDLIKDYKEMQMKYDFTAAVEMKALLYSKMQRFEDEFEMYEIIVSRLENETDKTLIENYQDALVNVAKYIFWTKGNANEAIERLQTLLRSDSQNILAAANLLWMLIASGKINEAKILIEQLDEIVGGGKALMHAGIELSRENLGASLEHLKDALDKGLDGDFDFSEDFLWYLRIGTDRGYGERLIEWFSETGNSDRYAPFYGAFVAYVRGEHFLLDLNPEVRGVATPLFAQLAANKNRNEPRDL